MKWNKKIIVLLVVLLATSSVIQFSASARTLRHPSQVDIDDLLSETLKLSPDPDRLTQVMWLPVQFWETLFHQDPSLSADEVNEIVNAFKDYVIVMVLDGKIGFFGSVTYASEEDIISNLRILNNYGVAHSPLDERFVNRDVRNMVNIFKPILGAMLGELGDNMYMFIFSSEGIDTTSDGDFYIQLREEQYSWRLPLASLFEPRTCPTCNTQLSGVYSFCPWDGTKI